MAGRGRSRGTRRCHKTQREIVVVRTGMVRYAAGNGSKRPGGHLRPRRAQPRLCHVTAACQQRLYEAPEAAVWPNFPMLVRTSSIPFSSIRFYL